MSVLFLEPDEAEPSKKFSISFTWIYKKNKE